jgi:RNA polymerase sigma-70 factor (ECF subfamily)
MIETTNTGAPGHLSAASRDQEAFQSLTNPYRRELLVHCYRILGSLEDAEDILQETLLRAWRKLNSLEDRASLRAWLYKIATNVSLDALDSRRRRVMPTVTYAAAVPGDALPEPIREPIWIEPLPDTLTDERPTFNPEARYDARESVEIAFLVALQKLPGRQRAVLILRDVLGWRASEVAALLDTSAHAVNSALQRARATMKQVRGDRATPALGGTASNGETESLLARYVAAWEAADSTALVALLREDAVMTMPPLPTWYRGRAAIRWFLNAHLFTEGGKGRFRLVATRANGSPAFAVYHRDEAGGYRRAALHVLTIQGDQIAEIHDFIAIDDRLFARFYLPAVL